jgi:hypothetical protein
MEILVNSQQELPSSIPTGPPNVQGHADVAIL